MVLSSSSAHPRTIASSLKCRFLIAIAATALNIFFIAPVRAANNAVPFVDIVSPVSIFPGVTNVVITVRGTGFVPASTVVWSGTTLTTTYVSAKELTASLPDAFVVAVGLGSVSVVSPAPGGGKSAATFIPVVASGLSTSFPTTPSFVTVGTMPQGIVTADFNADGKLDLAIANNGTGGSGTVSILLGNGDGTFTAGSTLSAGNRANWPAIGDFNEDGILDLAVANLGSTGPGGVSILLGNGAHGVGNGTFTLQTAPIPDTGSGPFAITAGDFNADGHLDLAVSNSNDGTITILLGQGNGTFISAGVPLLVGGDPQVIAAGDFDEDGKLDLAVTNKSDGSVSVLLNARGGSFQSAATFSTGGNTQSPIGLIAADFRGTGHLNLAAVNGGNIAILLGDGRGSFTLQPNPPSSGTSDLIAGVTGDYNGDGKLDLVVSDRTAGKAFLFLGNGDGTFGNMSAYTTAAGSFGLATADFNGDGGLDLAIANGSANNASIFLQLLPVGLNPTSLSFGTVAVNATSGSQAVTLTNSTGIALNFTTIGFSGANAGDFSQTNTCGSSIANNAACTITISFTPSASGPRMAVLTIQDNASDSPQTLAVGGGGAAAPAITSANTTTFYISTTGSFTVTTSGFPAPSLSETGMVPGGLTFTDNGNGTATLAGISGSSTGEVDILTFTAHNGSGPDATQVFTLTILNLPSITQSFSVPSIALNGTASLMFNLANANPTVALTGVAFTDNFPAGLVVATPNNLTNTCGGIATATSGASALSLSAGMLAVSGSCAVSLNVTGTTIGVKNNSVQFTSIQGGTSNTSNASVTVINPPTISKAFNPTSVVLNAGSTLSFTIVNQDTGIAQSGVSFADNLPAGMLVAAPPNVTGSCGSGMITASAGSAIISLTGGTLTAAPAAGSSCTFSVSVTGSSAGNESNITGNVASTEGGMGATSNTAILNVVAPPSIAKAFNPTGIALDASTTLTFTITNPAANTLVLTGVTFTDTLPSGLTLATSSASVCGGTLTTTTPASISLTAAAIAVNSQCVFNVTVTGTVSGNFTNVTGSVSSTNGGAGNSASANLAVAGPPSIAKAFGLPSLGLGGSTSLTFTITNPNTGLTLTGLAFTDNLPAGLLVATPNSLAGACGGVATVAAGASSLSLAAGTVPSSASCTLSVNVTATTAGVKNNSVQVTSTEGGIGNTSNASITVLTPPVISKAFGVSAIAVNGSTSLSFTIQNNNTATTLTGIGFTDTLPAGLVISSPNGLSGPCGSGTITDTPSTNVITLSGATLPQSSSCTFSVSVTGTAAGDQSNVTGLVTSANGGTGGTASAAIKVVSPPSIAKAFNPAAIAWNATTTLTFTTTNPASNTAALTGVAFTDTLPSGLTLSTSSASVCGGTLTTTAPASISLTAATIAVNSQCVFNVTVTGALFGSYTNVTGNVSSANGGAGNTASANLTVIMPPSITKAFGDAAIGLTNSTSLHFAIANPNVAVALTGVAFTDALPAGMVVSTPNGLSGSCGGGIITAAAAAQSVVLTGGTIAAGGSCTFSVNVTATAAGNQVNTTGSVSATNAGTGNTATASIMVLAPDLTIAKSHAGNFFQGQTGGTYSLTVNNVGAGPTAGTVTAIDALPVGIIATALAGAGWNCALGTLSCVRSDVLAAGASYPAVTVTVSVAAGAAASVTNRASVSGGGELNVANDGAADVTTITPPPDFTLSVTVSTITIKVGEQAGYAIILTPQNNVFANPITLSLGGLPVATSFTFNPSPVTPNASAATSKLLVSTTVSDPFVASNSMKTRAPLYALLVPLAGLVFSGFGVRNRRGRQRWLCVVSMIVCGGLGLYGCVGAATNFKNLGTPTGTYSITITATSGTLQRSAPITLIVQ